MELFPILAVVGLNFAIRCRAHSADEPACLFEDLEQTSCATHRLTATLSVGFWCFSHEKNHDLVQGFVEDGHTCKRTNCKQVGYSLNDDHLWG